MKLERQLNRKERNMQQQIPWDMIFKKSGQSEINEISNLRQLRMKIKQYVKDKTTKFPKITQIYFIQLI